MLPPCAKLLSQHYNNGSAPNGKKIELILISDYFKSLSFFLIFCGPVCLFCERFSLLSEWKIEIFLHLASSGSDCREHDFGAKMTWHEIKVEKTNGRKGQTIRRNYEFMFVISFWQTGVGAGRDRDRRTRERNNGRPLHKMRLSCINLIHNKLCLRRFNLSRFFAAVYSFIKTRRSGQKRRKKC